jgi:hypothetical protein
LLKNPVSQRDWDDAHLIDAAGDIHADDPGYGYRFIADELAELGIVASENRDWRLCSSRGIFSLRSTATAAAALSRSACRPRGWSRATRPKP